MTACYASIIVDISAESLDRVFQYRIPAAIKESIQPGVRVRVPFGKANRLIDGYVIELSDQTDYDPQKLKEIESVLTDSGSAEGKLLRLADWMRQAYGSTAIQALKTVLPVRKKIRVHRERTVSLSLSDADAQSLLDEFRHKKYSARERLLDALLREKTLSYEVVTGKLHITAGVLRALESRGVLSVTDQTAAGSNSTMAQSLHPAEPLTPAQQAVVQGIFTEWESAEPRTVLIRGITGSGKTRIYMELIRRVLDNGQQAIMLIPEIALTYQTVMRFTHVFGEKVSFLNSRMSAGERYEQFRRARDGEISIMVGPRSALFSPFPRLGLIVVDEEHETSYKSEMTPRYDAVETAIARMRMEHGRVVLGSATPSVDSYYRAKNGEYALFSLDERIGTSELPQGIIVDMREEFKAQNRSILSRILKEKIRQRLGAHQQVMLFLNRRGYASFVTCRSCGEVIKCPHCDVSLTIHQKNRLVCHYCGYSVPMVDKCPSCGSAYISGFRAGTQQIQELVQQEFPNARVLRMDADTTKKKDGHAAILSAFAGHEADILIGTQMIVKGHDFPMTTLVGVLAADLSLNGGGFRSSERTFQLITQAVGRAGRGELPGEAIIQTYQPEHYVITAAAKQDYEAFYEEEIQYRTLMGYPPSACMTAVRGSSKNEDRLCLGMAYLKKYVQKIYRKPDLAIIGPAPDAISRINDVYRQVIYIKHPERQTLIRIKDELERYIGINSGFRELGIQFDFTV